MGAVDLGLKIVNFAGPVVDAEKPLEQAGMGLSQHPDPREHLGVAGTARKRCIARVRGSPVQPMNRRSSTRLPPGEQVELRVHEPRGDPESEAPEGLAQLFGDCFNHGRCGSLVDHDGDPLRLQRLDQLWEELLARVGGHDDQPVKGVALAALGNRASEQLRCIVHRRLHWLQRSYHLS